MTVAIYPGSFDPITNGHLDIILRAASVYDEVVVTVMSNHSKKPMFSLSKRVELIEKVTQNLTNVTVEAYSGLLVDFANEKNAKVIIKGLRAVSDFEYEFQMALMNRKLNQNIETMFLMTQSQYSYLSSSVVKEVARLGGCIKELVPEIIEHEIVRGFKKE
ncbi:Phosphopantetheine adenylyltransferase [Tindallia magadiensis]|uniref:Phosphopantetheine adenylyltransferase n=1 Tax=Tindallia magadiensis TaxID=69895 RepID=A0A1I3ALM9_9FIRM|nr:pantetheine-phosphate adenylyltransferase [Tindallia magadiensis]SFH50988.1 Phosphopantetheine adenylyltransferase [Tindallia magadiensis]